MITMRLYCTRIRVDAISGSPPFDRWSLHVVVCGENRSRCIASGPWFSVGAQRDEGMKLPWNKIDEVNIEQTARNENTTWQGTTEPNKRVSK